MSGQPGGAVPGTVPFEDSLSSGRQNDHYDTGHYDEKGYKKDGALVSLAPIDPVAERKVLWKIDRNILILFFLIYGMQYLDKIGLSYAAIFGLKKDLKLVGQDYSWCASIFYFGQLLSEFVAVKALHVFPIKLYVGATVVLWGGIMMCNAAPTSFAGLMVARIFLGFMEGSVAPAFVVLISHWYKKSEHPLRIAVFVTADAVAQIAGALLLYGLGSVKGTSIAGWRISMLVAGAATIVIGGTFLLVVPVSPHTAWFLTEEERDLAVDRVAREHASLQHSEWRWDQAYETLRDPLFYLIFSWAFCICATSVVSFGSIVINGFGFSPLKTVLVGLPGPAIQILTIWLGVLACRFFPNGRGFIQTALILVPLSGVIMLQTIDRSHPWALTSGYWLATCNSSTFVINMSLISSNIKGHTRKSMCSTVYFIGYAVGCIVGPQLFRSTEAPLYPTAMRTISALYGVFVLAQLTFYALNRRENRRRDRLAAEGNQAAVARPAEAEDNETDKHDLGFRYVL